MPPYVPNQQVDPIGIYYQNGGNLASQMYVWNGTQPVLWDGQVSFSGTISIGQVSGSLTNNNAAPAANNLGALTAVVSTTALGYTSGRQVLLRVDTTGALVVSATIDTSAIATSANQTNGSQKTQVVNTTGATQAFGAGTTTTTTVRVVLPTDQTVIPVSFTTGTTTVSGTLTTNNAAPAANNVGVLAAIVSTTALGYTQGNQALLRVDTTGALVVSATISTTGLATASNQTDGSQKTQVVNTTGNTQAFDAGNSGTTTPRVVIATNQSAIPISGTITATISNATISVVSTTLATAANQTSGSQLTQVVNTTGNTQAFNSGVASSTVPRVVLADSLPYSSSLTNTVVNVTTAATRLAGYYIDNPNAAMTYIQLFNATAGAVTLGSTAPTLSFGIPASAAANLAGMRVSFTTALSIAATTTRAGSTGPSSVVDVNFYYE